MEHDDLKNSAQEEKGKTEITENVNAETNPETKLDKENVTAENVTEPEKDTQEEKKESAADLILKRLKKKTDLKADDKETEVTVEEVVKEVTVEADKQEVKDATEEKAEHIAAEEELKEASIVKVDYSKSSEEELLEDFSNLLEQTDFQKIRERVELIKVNFYKRHHAKIEADKNKFVEDGGKLEDFKPEEDKLEEKFKALYSIFKEKKTAHAIQLEQNKKTNLEKKYLIIDEIKGLINGQESMNKTFQEFKELQKQWQELGLVPQAEVKKLWDSYHYWVEKFYDYVNLNKELRDLDLKKNLERKLDLCQKAEELLLETKVVTAFKVLQKYHSDWREIGPVPSDKKEELWERFKKATTTINKKHQDYFEGLKTEQLNNLKAKTLICEKVEETNELQIDTPKAWEVNSKEIIELQQLWKLIGFAPKKENNQIYARFRQACDQFFNAKREFYSKFKEEEENNLQIKTELCIQAESMSESTEWKKTTDLYIALQKKWKTIGPVPRRQKDTIWHRFRTACNKFFDNKSAYYASLDNAQDENLELKKALVEQLNNFEFSDNNSENFEKLNEIQKQWTEIGFVPLKNKNEVQSAYREALDNVFAKLDLDEMETMKLKFRTKIESMKNSSKARGRIRSEREKISAKLDKLKADVVLWENNIGFFAKSKNAESMIKEFNEKIEDAKAMVQVLEEQLYMINDIDN